MADVTGDDVLDVVALMSDENRIFPYNITNASFDPPLSFGTAGGKGQALATTDIDGDNDIDLVVGYAYSDASPDFLKNGPGTSQILLNDGSGGFATFDAPPTSSNDRVQLFGQDAISAYSLSTGDVNGDGAIDIIAGELTALSGTSTRDWYNSSIYLNNGLGGFDWPGGRTSWAHAGDFMTDTQLADMNGDGTLDIVAVNELEPGIHDIVYLNDGDGRFDPTRASIIADGSLMAFKDMVLGDIDSDGDIDVLGQGKNIASVYLNDGDANFHSFRSYAPPSNDLGEHPILLGDIDRDGDPDIVSLGYSPGDASITWNEIGQSRSYDDTAPAIVTKDPAVSAGLGTMATQRVLSDRKIPIHYALTDAESDSVGFIRACFSLDGGDNWRYAVRTGESPPSPDQLVTPDNGCPFVVNAVSTGDEPLSTSPEGSNHVISWDTLASGFAGQSDNVVFRIEAYPANNSSPYAIARSHQYPYVSTTTSPFRVRGLQVQVFQRTLRGMKLLRQTPWSTALLLGRRLLPNQSRTWQGYRCVPTAAVSFKALANSR